MSCRSLVLAIKIGIGALLLTPFIVNNNFYFPFVGPKSLYLMAVVEVVFFIWLVLVIRWRQYRPDFKNPVVVVVLAFCAIAFASAVFGANFSASFWSKFERMGGVLMFGHLTALIIVISSVMRAGDWSRLFGASVIIASCVGINAIFNNDPNTIGGGFLGNDSFWGAYMLFNIFLAFYLFFSKELRNSKKLRIFFASVFFLLVFCLLIEGAPLWLNLPMFHVGQANPYILTSHGFLGDIVEGGARAAKISLVFGLSLIFILWLATRKSLAIKIAGRTALAVLFLAGTSAIVLSIMPGNAIYKVMENQFSSQTVHGRTVIWEIAWKGFLERPVLGWGFENFELAFTKYYNPCQGSPKCSPEVWFDRAHNVVLDTLFSTGIVGLIGYLSIFGASLWVLWKKYKNGLVDFAVAGVFSAMLAAYFLQNLTFFDTTDTYLMFFLVLGFIASLSGADRVEPAEISKGKSAKVINGGKRLRWYEWAGLGIIFWICFNNFVIGPLREDYLVVATAQPLYGKNAMGQTVIVKPEAREFGSDDRLAFYKETFSASPLGRYQVSDFFSQLFLDVLQNKSRSVIPVDRQIKEFEYLTGLIEKNIRDNPLDFKSRILLGALYTNWGLIDSSKFALAQTTLQEAIKMAPNDQEGYWNLAQTKLYQMRFDDALSLAQQALALYPGHPKSQTMVYQIEQIKQKMEKQPPAAGAPR